MSAVQRCMGLILLRIGLAMAAWLLGAGALHAQSCTIMMDTMHNMGEVDNSSSNPTDSSHGFGIDCHGFSGSMIRICVNLGLVSGTWDSRTLMSGGNALNYNLYQNSTRTLVWASVQDPQKRTMVIDYPLSGGGMFATFYYYGRVFGGQSVPTGTYSSNFTTNEGTVQAASYTSTPPTCGTSSPTIYTRFSLGVVATVTAGCSVSATNIDFGQQGIIRAPVDTTGLITATCGSGTNYTLELSVGNGIGATMNQRRMTRSGGTETLLYGLYRESGRTQVWGDGTSGSTTVSATGTGSAQTSTIYARLPPQGAKPGNYNDTITVTMTF